MHRFESHGLLVYDTENGDYPISIARLGDASADEAASWAAFVCDLLNGEEPDPVHGLSGDWLLVPSDTGYDIVAEGSLDGRPFATATDWEAGEDLISALRDAVAQKAAPGFR